MHELVSVAISTICLWVSSLLMYASVVWAFTFIKQNRIQYIELHEQKWCPLLFREIIITCLQSYWCWFGLTNTFGSPAQTVASMIYQKNEQVATLLDLCSGSGGPISLIIDELNRNQMKTKTTAITSDLFPNLSKWELLSLKNANIRYCKIPVDATNVNLNKIQQNLNKQLTKEIATNNEHICLRTIFNAFHHFSPKIATSILSDVMKCGDEFITVELGHRGGIIHFLLLVLEMVATIPALIVVQMISYVVDRHPICDVLLMVISTPIWATIFVHDGIVSCARSYKQTELIDLTRRATIKANKYGHNNIAYDWKCWTENANMMFPFNYLISMTVLYGCPK
eukprot:444121_1